MSDNPDSKPRSINDALRLVLIAPSCDNAGPACGMRAPARALVERVEVGLPWAAFRDRCTPGMLLDCAGEFVLVGCGWRVGQRPAGFFVDVGTTIEAYYDLRPLIAALDPSGDGLA